MQAELLALLAAASFGASSIALKKGYAHSRPLPSYFVVLAINASIFWVVSLLFVPLHLFLTTGVVFFVIGGILGQGLARSLQYTGIDKVGPARNHTILGSVPLFAAVFAIVILKESLTLPLFLGTLMVVAGVMLLTGEGNSRHFTRLHLLFPLSAAVLYGLVVVIQKVGLGMTANAIVAVTAATSSALSAIFVFSLATGRLKSIRFGKALPHFAIGGVFNSAAVLLNFTALSIGSVTVVMPLIGTQALFAVLWSCIFLKGVEKVTWSVVFGAAVIVAGAAIVTVF